VHRGLDVPAPVLVLTSSRSGRAKEYDDTVASTDIVLDVEQIRRWAHKLGDHVTLVRVEGAMHDVTLSRPPVREQVFAEVARWARTYLPPPPAA
jgi:alpha-beta hydrolase superfamily lysophospholipase